MRDEALPVRAPTLAPSPYGIHWARTHKVVAVVFAVGLTLFGYGIATTVLGFGPAGWGPVIVFQYVVMAIGGLLVALTALIGVWFWRQEQPRPLPRQAMLVTGVVAPFLATGLLVVVHWGRVGAVSFQLPFVHWVLVGQLVLAVQLYVGTLEPASRRRRILVEEAVAVVVVVFAALVVDRGVIDLASLESYLFVSGSAAGVFLLIGGLLYLLGYLLVCRPRYYQIP